ncbi:MAG: hypothetical protein CTY35_00130 [Methylotenera sp.]|uniref:replicative DNA helicase n=1 Tax=Methylotenera sp. TaxID=2051956 RepID=UPI000D3F90A9|nr:replicative DNA helicase [Methylotenera sp.]PPC84763.1 MAG: hypothetical protein CTY38_00130 [Methylotenera sp.]PPD02122.1 MAG: hypothetical protein CTY35_00130 [Methylotenera sp.]
MMDAAIGNTAQYSQETEQSLISLTLKDPSLVALCDSTDFYIADNGIIWRAISDLTARSVAIDPVTVNNLITKESGKDLFDYLADLYSMTVPADHADSYSKIVRDHSYSRHAAQTADKMKKIASGPLSSIEKSASFNALLTDLEALAVMEAEPMTMLEAMQQQAVNLESIAEGSFSVVKSGYTELDRIIGGFMGGDYIVIAGRPGMGKTALAMNIVENIAFARMERDVDHEDEVDDNVVFPVFSMEMKGTQLAGRFACSIAEIDASKMRSGALTEAEWARYGEAMAHVAKMNIVIDQRSKISADDIRQVCNRLVRKGKKIGGIFVDYLQIMLMHKDSPVESLTDISADMKAIAKFFDCPVFALSQLSRDVEKRADKRPLPSDLRGAGAIEQDADVIIMPYRDEVYHPDTPSPGMAELIVTKNRGGTPGVALVKFEGKFSRFKDADPFIDDDTWVEAD